MISPYCSVSGLDNARGTAGACTSGAIGWLGSSTALGAWATSTVVFALTGLAVWAVSSAGATTAGVARAGDAGSTVNLEGSCAGAVATSILAAGGTAE